MYKWFLALRYLHTKLIAFFGVASVMLCVAMVLVVISVMGGFLDTVRERSRGLNSEIVLHSGTMAGLPYYQEFAEFAKEKHPDLIELTTPVIHTYGLFKIRRTSWMKLAQIVGIRLPEYIKANEFKNGLHYEKFYPGTTRLGSQMMPVAGISQSGELRLPVDHETANAKWRASTTDSDAVIEYDNAPFTHTPYPLVTPSVAGERVFAADMSDPHHEGPERFGVIAGCDLLFTRQSDGNFARDLARGTEVSLAVFTLGRSGASSGEPPILIPLRYVDDSRTGIYEIDSLNVYVDFDMLQHKLAMDPQPLVDGGMTQARVSQLLIALKGGVNLNEARDALSQTWLEFLASRDSEISPEDWSLLTYATVMTWEDLQRPFITAIEKEKVLVTILFSLISMVAIVLLGCIFYMIVEKKTRDIGILKSVGASGRGVAGMFVVYAGSVGVVGSALGILLGAVFVWYINDIQEFLAYLNPQLRVWSPDVYSFDKIPNVVKRVDALWIGGIAVISSVIGSVIPATIAGRVWPVKALRYE